MEKEKEEENKGWRSWKMRHEEKDEEKEEEEEEEKWMPHHTNEI